jgi:hypothetical protein
MSGGEEDWTEAEKARLAALGRQEEPPPELEGRVVAELRARRLITPGRRPPTTAVAAAAAAVLFVCGVALGRATAPASAGAPVRPAASTFALFLHGGEVLDADPRAVAARVQEYRLWARGLAAGGRLVSGEKLKPGLRSLGGASPADVRPVQGFFLIRAASLDEAEETARTCPHLRHGGQIVVREIDPT